MRRRLGLAAAWTLATAVSVFIAGQAVGGVRNQVTDRPFVLPEITTLAGAATPTIQEEAPVTAAAPSSVTTTAAAEPSTVPETAPTTSIPGSPGAPTTPATTEPQQPETDPLAPPPATTSTSTTTTTTTTVVEEAWEFSQYDLHGGFVELKSRPGEVVLVSAIPKVNFKVKVEKAGPESVEVEFRPLDEADPYEGELHAAWRDGNLDVEIEEHFDDD